jgi:hypothetical protein
MKLSERDEAKAKLFKVASLLDLIVKQVYHLGQSLEHDDLTENQFALAQFMIDVYEISFTTALKEIRESEFYAPAAKDTVELSLKRVLERIVEDEKTSTKNSN